MAWRVLTPPLPSPIAMLAGAASHRVWEEQHHSLGRDLQAQSLCWVAGRAQDTHSVTGEALHQAEDGAVEDVRNHTAVTELLLLFPRSLHLGWKTRNGPLSVTSPQSHTATQEHRTSIVLMFHTPFQGRGDASCEGTRQTLLLSVVQGGGQTTQPTPVSSQEAEIVILELLFPSFYMFRSLALPQTVPGFLRSCDILLQDFNFISSLLTCLCTLSFFPPSDICHVFPKCLALERTLHSRDWPNARFCLTTNPVPTHTCRETEWFSCSQNICGCADLSQEDEGRMSSWSSWRDSGTSTSHCVCRLCSVEGF